MIAENFETNAEYYLSLFKEHGPASTYEIIDLLKDEPQLKQLDDKGRLRFAQGLAGFASKAHKDGKLVHHSTKISDSGKEVWVYVIAEGTIAEAEPVTSKGYKKRYDDLLVKYEKLEEQLAAALAFGRCCARERDEARRQIAA